MKALKKLPVLMIDPNVKYKMDNLVDLSNKEIAWHGYVKKEDNIYYWYDLVIYPQYVTGATVIPDEDEYTQWLIKQMERDDFENMRLHGHSHVNMSTTPSGVDMTFRNQIMKDIKENDYYIFIIVNKKDGFDLELYDYSSYILFDEHDVEKYIGSLNDFNETHLWAETVIKENIKEKVLPKCSTYKNQLGFSTQKKSQTKSTSLDVEPWEAHLLNYYQD